MLNQDSLIKYHEQLPPQNNLAEEIVLGGILVNIEIMQLAINELITESFCLETHQIIYRTIIEIYITKDYVDSIILINTLWDLNLLNHIGGIRKILNLLKNAQIFISQDLTYPTAQYYINLIKDKYLRRLLIQHGYNIIKLAYISSITPKTLFTKTNKYLENIQNQLTYAKDDNMSFLLSNLLINLQEEYSINNNKMVMSGFTDLDKISHGFKAGDLIVIAGRPSMGKTSFSLNIATNLIQKHSQSICIFSLEMSREQILYKLMSMLAEVSINKLQLGHINTIDWVNVQKAANQLVKSQIHINDNSNMSLSNLTNTAKTIKNTCQNLQLIIIDYLQLIQFDTTTITNRAEELSYITRSLKILAKELCVPIIVLSQLNRNVENRVNKQPMLSDLRESGCIGYHNKIIKTTYSLILYTRPLRYQQTQQSYLKPQIRQTQKQYGYYFTQSGNCICHLTHNHPVLTEIGWKRADTIKQNTYIENHNWYLKKNKRNSPVSYIISNFIKDIMYDLHIHETTSFICNSQYILHNSIEQDADLVLMLYREAYYNNQIIQDKQITNLIIAKHRNGPTGNIELQFNPTFSSFHNL
uniref:Replicative DNA helicase n=1 Tax=Neoizziella asiatica TaxID=1077397 RepID=A0A1G4NXM2_9FLOR|nr:Replication helicase subunit [Neoizziella asiatica]SCW23266.1 Replication helicase subunit [Neoizziella asiatica]